jgi:hypothetical protein
MKVTLAAMTVFMACRGVTEPRPAQTMAELESQLEALRAKYHVAGMSAAIAKDQQIVWTKRSVPVTSRRIDRPAIPRSFTWRR